MTEGRLDSRELDAIVARDDEARPAAQGAGPASAATRGLRQPVVALLAVLLVVGAVLGVRSYVVNRPPALAATIDAKLGASFSDSGFITLDDDGRGVLLSLVLRSKAVLDTVSLKGFFGPGLTDTRAHLDGHRVTVTGRTDCMDGTVAAVDTAGAGGATTAADYRLAVTAQDPWQREVSAELHMPAALAAQVLGTLRLACLTFATRSVELLALELHDTGAVVATMANRGSTRLYLRGLLPWGRHVLWVPLTAAALPADGHPVAATLVLRDAECPRGSERLRPVDGVRARLSTTAGSEAAVVERVLPVPAGSRSDARAMAVEPCRLHAP